MQELKQILEHLSYNQVKAEMCRRSFFYFIQQFWKQIIPEEPVWNWHIPYLCGQLTEMATRVSQNLPKKHDLVVNIPPGTTKSLLFNVFFPAWCWTNWYWFQFIKTSYSAALSLEHGERCRDLIRSEKYKQLFPELQIKRDADTKSNFRMVKKVDDIWQIGGNMYSTSVTGTVTGYHAHIILIDDPIDPFKAQSMVEMASANKWISQVLPTRKINKEVTATAMIMQRVETNDPAGEMLEQSEEGLKIKHICLPGILESQQDIDRVQPQHLVENYINNLLDPVRLSKTAIEELRIKLGSFGFGKQIQQNPEGREGSMFKTQDFKIINGFDKNEIKSSIRYWDKAGTTNAGCYTAGVLIHHMADGYFIIEDVIEGQWAAPEREKEIKQAAQIDTIDTSVWVEQEPGSGGKESAENTIRNLAGFCIYADKATGAKEVRAEPYAIQVENGNVKVLNKSWTRLFIRRHVNFPSSDNKDVVDAASGAMNKLLEDERPSIRVIE